MTIPARDLLETARRELAPGPDDNRLVPLVAAGKAGREVLGALAGEQYRIINSDWRSFLTLAARGGDGPTREFFAGLAHGEGLVLPKLVTFAAACGMDEAALREYRPRAGCQAYPAYVAWLALNADPRDAVLALVANFAAWGEYCGAVARGLREHYGFDDNGCAFFDFFASPAPEVEQQALAAVQTALDAGWDSATALGYGRLVQDYELMFWNTLAG
ncbi:transcriptional regulator [Gandjariella thermophila]|uniref:Thiaminase-2/PQQC domain-containing protein n=1 Tax=Gandjariella thermophila TaxID=1931992 RepID=A0A4D4IVU2_9PSEU|nr:transcriptional regulator [Gandjariella thermophila]GDY28465.1 hypothetical protein GTS_00980 [Gandjariella thermophila]